MADFEKIIKGLETCIPMKYETSEEKECRHEVCPYSSDKKYSANGCFWDLMEEALELLKEQQPKTGHWIPIKSPTGVEAFGIKEMDVFDVRCSVCGAEEDVMFSAFTYCPRCGAKMENATE